jgi:arabinogalactan endo-1,4-beta-galactosidase
MKNLIQTLLGGAFLMLPLAAMAYDYAIGADLSSLKQAEEHGTVFKDGGQPRPGLQILKDHGYIWMKSTAWS